MSAAFSSPSCPQCGGSLPRQALWRAVTCSYCQAQVTLNTRWVERATFRAAWARAHPPLQGDDVVRLAGSTYRLLAPLGQGERAEAWLAERQGTGRLRGVIKRAPAEAADRLAREADTLREIQRLSGPGSAYFSLRLPQLLAQGATASGTALAMRAWPGFWGSLADVLALRPEGLADPRHAVWLWRRVLELLEYLHGHGWCHGDLRPEHWLIHPTDHGVHLVGWGRATRHGDPAVDLQQSAWAVRAALAGPGDSAPALPARCPPALAALLRRASEDRDRCRHEGAAGLIRQLSAAALADFGPPRFVPFDPQRA
ncbi:MAG: protein kinase family protein [Burkholderiales bacterium]|uniref:protein kinase family protein n=1 Tax=Roseateles sp. TaxID=1971397 RepID=UPI000FB21235|nr:MAG: protein kinase family protein [Burkholderiales bacterium]